MSLPTGAEVVAAYRATGIRPLYDTWMRESDGAATENPNELVYDGKCEGAGCALTAVVFHKLGARGVVARYDDAWNAEVARIQVDRGIESPEEAEVEVDEDDVWMALVAEVVGLPQGKINSFTTGFDTEVGKARCGQHANLVHQTDAYLAGVAVAQAVLAEPDLREALLGD